MFHAGGGADAFLDEHAVIVVADHSHAPVERRIELDGAFDDVPPPAAERRGPRRGRDRAVPGAALGDGLRAAARGPRASSSRGSSTRRAALDGVDLVMWRPAPREGAIRGAARRAALRPGRRPARRARRALVGRRAARGPRRRRRATASSAPPTYPDALARVWAALICETSGDVLLSARARLGVRRLGRGRPRRRRQPRLAAPQRLARRARVLRRRPARRRPPAALVDRRRRADDPRALRGRRARLTGRRAPLPSAADARACGPARRGARRARPRAARGARRACPGPVGHDVLDGRSAPPAPATTQTDPNAAVPVPRMDQAPAGYRLTRQPGPDDRRAQPGLPQRAREATADRSRTSTRRGRAAGRSACSAPGQKPQGARPGLRRRRDGHGDRGLDRLPGRVDDGARLPRARSGARSTRRGSGSR